MAVLNHHIVHTRDKTASARFYSEMLGLEPAVLLGDHFAVLKVSDDTTLDFMTVEGDIPQMHYAFLVGEAEFDEVFARIRERDLPYWADPMRAQPGEINHWDDGRGVYFPDPDDHALEILTRSYGSGGTEAEHPHPLIAPTVEDTV